MRNSTNPFLQARAPTESKFPPNRIATKESLSFRELSLGLRETCLSFRETCWSFRETCYYKCYENQRKTIVFWPRGAWGPRTVQKFPPGGPGRFQGTPAVVTLGSQGWPIGTQTHGLSGDPGGPKQWVSIGLIAFGDFMWFFHCFYNIL